LASSCLSEARLPKVNVSFDEIFYYNILSLTKAVVALTNQAFSGYLKKALSLGYFERDARKAFQLVAEVKIMRKIYPALVQILSSDYKEDAMEKEKRKMLERMAGRYFDESRFVTLEFKIPDGKDLFKALDKHVRLCVLYFSEYVKKQELTSADIAGFLREFIPQYIAKKLVSIFDKIGAESSPQEILNP
jgi:hypothetical protein